MALAPWRVCSQPGCHQRVRSGRCEAHQQVKRQQETRFQRGLYGRPWRRARDRFIAEHPWCVDCLKDGKRVVAEEVDHIVPHRGDSALFWDETNWQSMCLAHHSAKTAREVGWRGGI